MTPSTSSRPLVALVTGASRGIGAVIAAQLAARGVRVALHYRNRRSEADALPAKLAGSGHAAFAADFAKPEAPASLWREVTATMGGVDILINNAGFAMGGFLEDLSDQDLKDQMNTNVFGYLRVIRSVAPVMRRQGSGKIINVSSISGRVVFPALGSYVASKHAVRALSEALRQELRPWGIDVAELAPGSFVTQVVTSARYGKNAKNPKSPNYPYTIQMEKLMTQEFSKGRPAQEVAQRIVQALERPIMKPVYIVGPDAKFMAFLKWLLPDFLFEGFFLTLLPWSRFPRNKTE